MADQRPDRLNGKNPNRSMRLRQPTAEQRRIVGELILLGNERRRLFEEAFKVESQLRETVAVAYRDHHVPKRIIARASSLARHTVYDWLVAAGLHERGREAALREGRAEISDAE